MTGCRAFGHSLGGGVLLKAEEATPGLFSSLTVYEPVLSSVEAEKRGPLVIEESVASVRF